MYIYIYYLFIYRSRFGPRGPNPVLESSSLRRVRDRVSVSVSVNKAFLYATQQQKPLSSP